MTQAVSQRVHLLSIASGILLPNSPLPTDLSSPTSHDFVNCTRSSASFAHKVTDNRGDEIRLERIVYYSVTCMKQSIRRLIHTLNISTISLNIIEEIVGCAYQREVHAGAVMLTYWGQMVLVMAVPALGAIQFALILYRAPSMAAVLVRPMIADLAVE